MNIGHYQIEASRTSTPDESWEEIAAMALGLASEAGEVAGEVKKAREQQREIDRDKVLEEVGDTLWYMAAVCRKLGISMELAAVGNLAKLWRRYPDGFSAKASQERRDKGST